MLISAATGEHLTISGLRKHRRPRLDEFDYRGRHGYHLVIATVDRQPVLVAGVARNVCIRIVDAASACAFDLLVYTLMPNHLHMLVHGQGDESDALAFMKRLKQTTSYDFIQGTGQPLWQQSFYDHVLRRDEDANVIAKYILENPVRAGLCEAAEDWAYTGGTLVPDRGLGRT